MTQVDFYTHAEDRFRTIAQLCVKALARQLKVYCLTPDAARSEQLSRVLWSTPSTGFLPHCRAADTLAARTPIVIDHGVEALPHHQILINLCAEAPQIFSRFDRLIEVVTTDEEDREQARARFRFYRDRGYEIRTHALTQGET
jgi:DNA polymerase-3 subunit chi